MPGISGHEQLMQRDFVRTWLRKPRIYIGPETVHPFLNLSSDLNEADSRSFLLVGVKLTSWKVTLVGFSVINCSAP